MNYLDKYNIPIPGALNFTYKEMIKSETALRKGIENIPNEYQILNIQLLAQEVLQPLRNEFGPIKINSGFRCEELNIAIGGSPNSNHCRGEAADINLLSNISLMIIINIIYKYLEFDELIAEYFPYGWIHVSYRDQINRKRLKLKDKLHNYKIIDIDYLNYLY
jgi:hypothetical protein